MAAAVSETAPPLLTIEPDASFEALERLVHALGERRKVACGGLWGASQALVLSALVRRAQGPWLVLVSTEAEAEVLMQDLEAFGARPRLLVAREGTGARPSDADPDSVRRRLQVAAEWVGPPERRPRLLVASLLSVLQPLPQASELERERVTLERGATLDVEGLLRRLVKAGYSRQPLVERPGEVSRRGDILDIYPLAANLPLRVELLDEQIESLRWFDPALQTSVETVERTDVSLAADAGGVEDGTGVQPVTLLAPTAVVVEMEPLRIADRAEGLRIQSASHQRALRGLHEAMEARRRVSLQSLPARDVDFDTRSVQALCAGMRQAPGLLREAAADGTRVLVACRNEAEEHRFRQLLDEAGGAPGVETRVGNVSQGFRLPAQRLVVVAHRELAGIVGARRRATARPVHKSRALQSFFDLKPGDYVVHAVHGLALYRGLARMQRGSAEEEHLHLEFADEVSLFVPACRIDLVQRYIGSGGGPPGNRGKVYVPPLDRIGSQSFRKRRDRVQRALVDLAAELLEVQAQRELRRRDPWRADHELMTDMIGSFPYTDTTDQASAWSEIAADMSAPRPMDRLLCGDVGFGKTELAVRAAFSVAAAGGQVAVLVPTTVLAHQHLATFRERLGDFPVTVDSLTRTAKGKAEREVLERLAEGALDIVIGTHRILSKDVRFKQLGLVIVDEEQRFGVAHKEHFKALRATTDILTLSATPIPRTLHMSLSGVRDISALGVPPPGRQEIETVLAESEDDALIRGAILREKNRGGQVFFLHNRVQTIDAVAQRLAELVPECSFAVGHGQMGARELEGVMDLFTRGEADCLVATTIVENGLDIPAAGTIFIDQADHFGLAELHQLRGRVGRGEHKAVCYLLLERHKPIRDAARQRLAALEEMNQLGAGFQISMKDLEIRGAGNILGPEQSGHIAAVGYDMYCRLLKVTIERVRAGQAVESLAGDADVAPGVELELGLRAFLPEAWIPSQDTRLEVLRTLDLIHTAAEADAALAVLRDRFGRVPEEAETLVRTFRLRARLFELGIRRVAWQREAYLLEYEDRLALEPLLAGGRKKVELRHLRDGIAHLMIPRGQDSPLRALSWLEGLLGSSLEPAAIQTAGERP